LAGPVGAAGDRESRPMTGARCEGVVPLTARLEPWMAELAGSPDHLEVLLAEHGSPVNLLTPAPMARNAVELAAPARERGVPCRMFFARKANKALSFVDRALELGLGIDVASERELRQALERGVPPADVIITAAVKPRRLLELALEAGVTVAIDNRDELRLLGASAELGRGCPVAIRLAPRGLSTRFGVGADEALELVDAGAFDGLDLAGVHFHLDGCRPEDRVAALAEAIVLGDQLSARGHPIRFIDIGGGVPMSYLDSAGQWDAFWAEHRAAVAGKSEPLTYGAHRLGLDADGSGNASVYPYHQRPVRGEWLASVLDAALPAPGGETVARALVARGLELRCEPGRSLLDGCGATAARVEFRKRTADGTWLIGAAMNRTQCRSTSDDFMVDPLLVRSTASGEPTGPIEAYLVGAYCIERELLTWRRLRFPDGVAVGDVLLFPNTAGYLMHILESASHQIPLARNLVLTGEEFEPDPIDELGAVARPA